MRCHQPFLRQLALISMCYCCRKKAGELYLLLRFGVKCYPLSGQATGHPLCPTSRQWWHWGMNGLLVLQGTTSTAEGRCNKEYLYCEGQVGTFCNNSVCAWMALSLPLLPHCSQMGQAEHLCMLPKSTSQPWAKEFCPPCPSGTSVKGECFRCRTWEIREGSLSLVIVMLDMWQWVSLKLWALSEDVCALSKDSQPPRSLSWSQAAAKKNLLKLKGICTALGKYRTLFLSLREVGVTCCLQLINSLWNIIK